MKPWLPAAGLLLLAACPAPKRSAPPRELRIGAVLPLTGPQASYGVACQSGMDLAVREANAGAGPLGRRVRAIYVDSQGRPDDAALAAQRSITKDKVELLIGEVSSAGAMAVAQVAQRARTPMISPSATAPGLTQVGTYVFRVAYADPFQARAMASFARQSLKLEQVAVLRDLSNEYSLRLAKAFAERFTELGGEVVFDEAFDAHDASIFPVVEKLSEAGVQFVYLPAYEEELRRILGALDGLGKHLDFLGADGWDVASVVSLGPSVEGSYFTTHFSSEEPRPEVQRFSKAFHEVYNETPDAMAALGYDAIGFALAAVVRAESSERSRWAAALAEPVPFAGVTGALIQGPQRQPQKAAVVVQIKGGLRHYVARLPPEPPASAVAP